MMQLKLFNTLSRKKEIFKSSKPNQVSLYTCGPTVYHYAHIGNLRTYIFEDLLKRTLLYNKYKVKQVMNITDVGHLTSDADTGEDKMLLGAKREHKTVWEIADFYTKEFQNDLKKLNILFPDIWCKATDHIKEQIEFIQKLEKRGYAYAAGGNVYFDTAKVKEYGKLALLDLTKEKKARVEKDPHKKNQHDFVLWFTKSKFLEQEMKWDSPWGKGYPGWHIECSAMSIKYLGETIDIHCGGIDHIPTHHTNEIAQSEAATGKKFVNFWMHGEFLVLEEKMSKSKGNMITLSTIEEKGFSPLDYRYFCLNAHYKKPLKFSWEGLDAAKNARERIKEKVLEIRKIISPSNASTSKRYKEQFIAAINDDLNMPEALAVLWFALKDRTVSAKDLLALIEEFDKIFGLDLLKEEKTKIPKETIALAEEREKYRKQKNFSKADEIRKELSKKGYVIEDNDAGYKIKKIK